MKYKPLEMLDKNLDKLYKDCVKNGCRPQAGTPMDNLLQECIALLSIRHYFLQGQYLYEMERYAEMLGHIMALPSYKKTKFTGASTKLAKQDKKSANDKLYKFSDDFIWSNIVKVALGDESYNHVLKNKDTWETRVLAEWIKCTLVPSDRRLIDRDRFSIQAVDKVTATTDTAFRVAGLYGDINELASDRKRTGRWKPKTWTQILEQGDMYNKYLNNDVDEMFSELPEDTQKKLLLMRQNNLLHMSPNAVTPEFLMGYMLGKKR